MVVRVFFVMMRTRTGGLTWLRPSDMGLVEGDVTLWFRGLSLFILAEDVREQQGSPTQLVLEQPEDPARYREPQDVEQHQLLPVNLKKENVATGLPRWLKRKLDIMHTVYSRPNQDMSVDFFPKFSFETKQFSAVQQLQCFIHFT